MGQRPPFAVRKAPAGCQVSVGRQGGEHPDTGFSPLPPASLPFAILTLVNAPYKRGFYCGDDSIRYPYRPDTITHGLMAGVTITATVVLVRLARVGGRAGCWVLWSSRDPRDPSQPGGGNPAP